MIAGIEDLGLGPVGFGLLVAAALRDDTVILAPLLLVLRVVILFPDLMLFLPRLIMPRFID